MKNKVKQFYDHYWRERGLSGNRFRYSIFLSWLESGAKILDVGCGDGYLAELLKNQKKAEVVCMDISEEALKIVQSKGIKTVQGNLDEPLPFESKSFDYVIGTEIIEHIVFSEAALREMARVAKKYILVSIPNSAFWRYRWQLLRGRFFKQWVFQPYEHVRFWSVIDFKDTIKSLGLKIEQMRASAGRRYLRDFWPNLFTEQVCYKIKV